MVSTDKSHQLQSQIRCKVVPLEIPLRVAEHVRVIQLSELVGEDGISPGRYKFIAYLLRMQGRVIAVGEIILSGYNIDATDFYDASNRVKHYNHEDIARSVDLATNWCFGGVVEVDEEGTVELSSGFQSSLTVGDGDYMGGTEFQEAFALSRKVSELCGMKVVSPELLDQMKALRQGG